MSNLPPLSLGREKRILTVPDPGKVKLLPLPLADPRVLPLRSPSIPSWDGPVGEGRGAEFPAQNRSRVHPLLLRRWAAARDEGRWTGLGSLS